jgi:hypothetical protein
MIHAQDKADGGSVQQLSDVRSIIDAFADAGDTGVVGIGGKM